MAKKKKRSRSKSRSRAAKQPATNGTAMATANGTTTTTTTKPTAVKTRSLLKPAWTEGFYNVMAVAAVGVSAAAFLIEGGPIVMAVSGVCAFLGPAAAMQQHRLTDLENMRILQNQLRSQVNRFQQENSQLRKENGKLAESAKRLQQVEANLKEISKVQGQSVDTLMKQMEEYRRIQQKVQESLEAKIIQNLIDVVIRSDNDQDCIIDQTEIDGLFRRLQAIQGVDFSEKNFKKAIERAGYRYQDIQQGGINLSAVIAVVKNLLDDTVPQNENIFTIDPQRLLPRELRLVK